MLSLLWSMKKMNKVALIEIINRKDLKVGDKVLFSSHIVEVVSISIDVWTFKSESIGGTIQMPMYQTYYKILEVKKDEE